MMGAIKEMQIVASSPDSDIQRINTKLPIICLDGAIYRLLEAGIVPEYLIGDLDAADQKIQEKARSLGTQVIYEPDQNSNDLEKGINLANMLGATNIQIFQALGGRLDHTLYNLGLLKKFYPIKLAIITSNETISYIEDVSFILEGLPNSPLAIMGFPEAKVTSKGLQYDMKDLILKIGGAQSSSNKLASEQARVCVAGAAILISSKDVEMRIPRQE